MIGLVRHQRLFLFGALGRWSALDATPPTKNHTPDPIRLQRLLSPGDHNRVMSTGVGKREALWYGLGWWAVVLTTVSREMAHCITGFLQCSLTPMHLRRRMGVSHTVWSLVRVWGGGSKSKKISLKEQPHFRAPTGWRECGMDNPGWGSEVLMGQRAHGKSRHTTGGGCGDRRLSQHGGSAEGERADADPADHESVMKARPDLTPMPASIESGFRLPMWLTGGRTASRTEKD